MADKKLQALDRLIGKLSAVRKTLRGEERRLLDQMVLSLTTEVAPHSQRADKQNADNKTSSKQLRQAMDAPSEVAMHGMNVENKSADAKTATPVARIAINARSGIYETVVD